MRIVIATGNQGKMEEFKAAFADFPGEILSLHDIGFTGEIVESGATFSENAALKARSVGPMKDTFVLSDDSGLSIDALHGEPGVYSARYLGEDTPQAEKNADILRRLCGLPKEKRTCRFQTVMHIIFPDGTEKQVNGVMNGYISEEAKGTQGFGYDPIFFLPETNSTTAEISREEKNRYSHRGQAVRKAIAEIRDYLKKKQ